MNKPEYVHYDAFPLVRSMSPKAEREFNNISLMIQEEMMKQLTKEHSEIVRIGISGQSYLNKLQNLVKNKKYREQLEYIKQIYEESGLSTEITPYPDSYTPEFRKKQIFDFAKFVEITSKGDND